MGWWLLHDVKLPKQLEQTVNGAMGGGGGEVIGDADGVITGRFISKYYYTVIQ